MKRFAPVLTVLMLMLAASAYAMEMDLTYDGAVHRYSADDIHLVVNGTRVTTGEMPPVIISGRTMVPVREVFEAMGGTVGWDGATSSVTISYGGTEIALNPGSHSIYVDGEGVKIPSDEPAPMIINNKTMAPVRTVADQLGFSVEWEGDSRTVVISDDPSDDGITGTISDIRIEEVGNAELIYLVYDYPAEPEINRYSNPERVSLDFPGAQLESGSCNLGVDGDLVTGVRGANHDGMARIVLDVNSQPNIEVSNYENGVVVAVTPAGGDYDTDVNSIGGKSGNIASGAEDVNLSTEGTVDISKSVDLDYGSIVIDAGHGGKTGASSDGVMEDDITLAIAKKVRDKLEDAGFNVVMTREKDVRVELQTRVDIASGATSGNKLPCLFVSVHCNAFERESANGTQVYYHPESRYGTMLAQNIYNCDVANTTLKAGSIHDGSTLFVIRKTLQPAALVETAFLTNDGDRAYLTSEEGQEALATGITEGIIMTVEQMRAEKN